MVVTSYSVMRIQGTNLVKQNHYWRGKDMKGGCV